MDFISMLGKLFGISLMALVIIAIISLIVFIIGVFMSKKLLYSIEIPKIINIGEMRILLINTSNNQDILNYLNNNISHDEAKTIDFVYNVYNEFSYEIEENDNKFTIKFYNYY